jgi:TPR repeat protein
MKSNSAMLACLGICLLLMARATNGHSQGSGATQNSAFTKLSTNVWQVEKLRQKWETVSTADLLKAAQSGDAPAEYYYWARQWNHEYEYWSQAMERMQAIGSELTQEEKHAAAVRWKAVGDAEMIKAAAGGDKGAQMVAAEIDATRATEQVITNFEWLKKSAEQGFPVAECDAAIRYLGQSGWAETSIDQQKGLVLLERAAAHNWAPAQYRLGMLYVIGELLPPDSSKAIEYLRQAADQGNPRSQYELAQLYAEGIGEPRSTADLPIALLRCSATNGYSMAFHALAERYRTGLGIPVDYVRAIRYYQAAREADAKAGVDLDNMAGDIFELVDENLQPRSDTGPNWSGFARVLSVYLKASERGDADAMCQLGEWYLMQRFVPQDPVAAYYWFDRAADLGVATAAKKRDAIRAKLRPEQLERAAELNEPGP